MKIYDAHIHFWDYQSGCWPWLEEELAGADRMIGNTAALKHDYFPRDFYEDSKKFEVENCTFVQAFGFPDNPLLELKWVSRLTAEARLSTKSISFIDLRADVENELDCHREVPGFCGVRNVLCYDEKANLKMIDNPNIFNDKHWLRGIRQLEEAECIFETQIFSGQLPALINLARRYPRLKIVLEHFAWPLEFSKHAFALWKMNIAKLGRLPNVYAKISAIGCVFKRLDKMLIEPYFNSFIDSFGLDKCLFGSNFPVDKVFFGYDQLVDFVDDELCYQFSEQEKNQLFYLTAKNLYQYENARSFA